jgi:hypothetical protein
VILISGDKIANNDVAHWIGVYYYFDREVVLMRISCRKKRFPKSKTRYKQS